ncbi:ubiquinol-cytochrome C family chaperone, putative [Babesia ovata]|uniref:Ubiquinol-cytochrome C family chaperone, putative n=1 Tax=Babesia ovata TaxID=189622 RepID=A0A2H6K6P2_9APIC|nr:ubiquinol-cytochrome C family chaperone, putative [Babesia ovata]GBE58649.1 ubiquinol-cytochrome C family chaperone, putative [Babesia ovata]
MQHKTLGFCLALDESMDEIVQKGDDTTLRKMLIMYVYALPAVNSRSYFYQRNSGMMQSQPLDLLTKYILALVDFVSEVPEEEFRYAAFTWPEIDHYIANAAA